MFISVVADLPSLTRFAQFKDAQSSVLLDDLGHPIGVLSQQNRVIVTPRQIPQIVKEAVISIEDKRFYTNSGIDIRGIARAFVQDIRHKGSVQGASTIEQQFIKNALQAQSHRTIFEKLSEAALAYQLSHKWSKDKIITAYLNTIYFGNGAYGIEAAARDLLRPRRQPPRLRHARPPAVRGTARAVGGGAAGGDHPVAHRLRPDDPPDGGARRGATSCSRQMLEQGYMTRPVYDESIKQALPAPKEVQAPQRADRRRRRRRLLHQLGAAAGGRTLRRPRAPSTAACRSGRRSTSTCSAPPNRPSTATCPAPAARPPRWW